MYGARMDGKQRLAAELTLRDGKVVYDLNGITRPEWTTLPKGYTRVGDAAWDTLRRRRRKRKRWDDMRKLVATAPGRCWRGGSATR